MTVHMLLVCRICNLYTAHLVSDAYLASDVTVWKQFQYTVANNYIAIKF